MTHNPDVIFANKRIDKVNTLIRYEIISIVINRGMIIKETFFSKNEID